MPLSSGAEDHQSRCIGTGEMSRRQAGDGCGSQSGDRSPVDDRFGFKRRGREQDVDAVDEGQTVVGVRWIQRHEFDAHAVSAGGRHREERPGCNLNVRAERRLGSGRRTEGPFQCIDGLSHREKLCEFV